MHELLGGRRTAKSFMHDEWRPSLFYHVIGKAFPGRKLFRSQVDMRYFLRHVLRFKVYHFLDVIAYCLSGNHFHLVVRTRSLEEVCASLLTKPERVRNPSDEAMLRGAIPFPDYAHHTMSGAIGAYARHYNKKYGREGQLFVTPTLHGLTDKGAPGEEFSRRLCAYVGLNFVKHHLAPAGNAFYGSSLTNPMFKIVNQDMLLQYFGGQDAYLSFHQSYLRKYGADLDRVDESAFYAALTPRHFDAATREWVEGSWEVGPPGGLLL